MEHTYIDIMIQSLEKKEKVLDKIIELDIEQKEQLENPDLSPDEFDKVVEEKAELIEQLEQLDSGFEKLFERTKDELEVNKEYFSEDIRCMQKHIKSITDKSMKIQSQEARNKDLMMKKFSSVKRQTRQIRKGMNVANKYYKNMTKTESIDPQFMDNKK